MLSHLLKISGEQYEYELAMLIALRDLKVTISEVPIETVYLNNNESSKFNPFIDSMKIYFVLFRFMFSSLLSAFIDFVIFLVVIFFTDSILTSLIVSRIIVSIINYFVNLRLVFKKTGNTALIMVKYYILLVFMAGLSYILIKLFNAYGVPVASAKILAETMLFAISFTLQRDYVFRNATNEMTDEKD